MDVCCGVKAVTDDGYRVFFREKVVHFVDFVCFE
jgi:hypothetical protein